MGKMQEYVETHPFKRKWTAFSEKKGVEQGEWQKIKEELKLDISNRQQAIICYIFLLSELKKKPLHL